MCIEQSKGEFYLSALVMDIFRDLLEAPVVAEGDLHVDVLPIHADAPPFHVVALLPPIGDAIAPLISDGLGAPLALVPPPADLPTVPNAAEQVRNRPDLLPPHLLPRRSR